MNVYEQVTENIVSMLEQGDVPPWRKEWTGEPLSIPHNGVTGHQYKGVNVWNLLMTAWAKQYSSNQWATYKQWKDKGGQVIKGEKSTVAVFFKPLDKIDDSARNINCILQEHSMSLIGIRSRLTCLLRSHRCSPGTR